MTYRDDNDALRARVLWLEAELARVNMRNPPRGGASAGPETMRRGVRFSRVSVAPFEISDGVCLRIAAFVEQRLGIEVVRGGRSLHAGQVFSLVRANGATRVRVAAAVVDVAAAVSLGRFVAFLMPGTPVILTLCAAGQQGMHALALQLVWIVPAIVFVGGWLAGKVALREADHEGLRLATAFEAVSEMVRASAPRVEGHRLDEAR